ncbi:hypothetical protein GWK47_016415 [Chionoecetes opilio]|uniref:Uncharacterized protein n=1 Tax=Chionoecetes opilio TaxID=41210 RepID=A0A8J4XTE8_CHIOP|nr:hypothetical protein GWK47_016415 [Chionoecetes opilio]
MVLLLLHLQYPPEFPDPHVSGLLSTSQATAGFQHLKLRKVDGPWAHPPGLMESSRTTEWFGWTFTTEEQVGETEKFFKSPLGWFFDIRASFGKGQWSSFSLLAVSLVAKNSTRSSDFSTVSLARNPRRTIDHGSRLKILMSGPRKSRGWLRRHPLRITSWT